MKFYSLQTCLEMNVFGSPLSWYGTDTFEWLYALRSDVELDVSVIHLDTFMIWYSVKAVKWMKQGMLLKEKELFEL